MSLEKKHLSSFAMKARWPMYLTNVAKWNITDSSKATSRAHMDSQELRTLCLNRVPYLPSLLST